MNKRQPTFLQTEDAGHIANPHLGKCVRTHVLDKATSLQQDIASLDDPNITELYELLTTELREPSGQDQHDAPTTSGATTEQMESAGKQEISKVWLESKASKSDVVLYVHNMAEELKDICLAADLKFLAYLVDMARVEANSILAQQTRK
ncbi:MAG: hypothetical protein HKN11_20640 [Rhizobiales bacterium]|nr:hypothetical protein [Hyphomicrobiales bacterium]